MVNYKNKYLEMKLKYINAKNILTGGAKIEKTEWFKCGACGIKFHSSLGWNVGDCKVCNLLNKIESQNTIEIQKALDEYLKIKNNKEIKQISLSKAKPETISKIEELIKEFKKPKVSVIEPISNDEWSIYEPIQTPLQGQVLRPVKVPVQPPVKAPVQPPVLTPTTSLIRARKEWTDFSTTPPVVDEPTHVVGFNETTPVIDTRTHVVDFDESIPISGITKIEGIPYYYAKISNDGHDPDRDPKDTSNQCFWISISQWMHSRGFEDYNTVEKLKNAIETYLEGEQMPDDDEDTVLFDGTTNTRALKNSIDAFLTSLQIGLRIFALDRGNKKLSIGDCRRYGFEHEDCKNRFYNLGDKEADMFNTIVLVSTGYHFELVTYYREGAFEYTSYIEGEAQNSNSPEPESYYNNKGDLVTWNNLTVSEQKLIIKQNNLINSS